MVLGFQSFAWFNEFHVYSRDQKRVDHKNQNFFENFQSLIKIDRKKFNFEKNSENKLLSTKIHIQRKSH
jgi:hypothetical protein